MPDETERTELIRSIEDFLKPILMELNLAAPRTGPGRPWVLPAVALWAGSWWAWCGASVRNWKSGVC